MSDASNGGSAERTELARVLGPWDAALLTIGSVIGSGIFIVSADIVRELQHGGLLLLVWLGGGLLSLAGALTYAELGVMFPRAGGLYDYLKEAYGPVWGFLYGWGAFLVMMSGGIAALAVAFAEFLGGVFPGFVPSTALATLSLFGFERQLTLGQAVAVAAILSLTAVNVLGVRAGAWTQNVLTLIKVGAIVVFTAIGLATPAATDWSITAPIPSGTNLWLLLGVGMMAALWTYDGWYAATFSAGEMRQPSRALPIGLIVGTATITLLYLGLNVVYLRALPLGEMSLSTRVGETAATALFGVGAGRLLSAAIVVSTFGCLAATVLYTARIYLAMARDGSFFRSLAKVHPRFRTPAWSLWAHGAWASLLALSGTYEQLYIYATFAAVLFHVGAGASIFVLRRTRPDAPRPYRAWGYPVVPLLFVATSAAVVWNTLLERPIESLLGVGMLLAGLPAYAFWRRRARRPLT
ncbi:MAG: amino acid permease [Thermoanaerobaculia bacterium]|nr:amino acid permease [Thermoanaerobaculia bacterium]